LLVAYISPICALLAPCGPGASSLSVLTNFWDTTLADANASRLDYVRPSARGY
jgi:hypothetical protein